MTYRYSSKHLTLAVSMLVSLAACSQSTSVKSDVIDDSKINQIKQNIAKQYPNADSELQDQILDVAVKAIDNLVFIKGGSYMMGDIMMPCDVDNVQLAKWKPGAKCVSDINSIEYGTTNLHKVTLSNYSLSKFETTYYDMNAYRLAHQLPLIEPKFNAKRLKRATPVKTWQQAKDFCTWLGDLTGYPFDLPTEAQWEYAARDRGKNIYYATNDGEVRPKKRGRYVRDKNGTLHYKEWQPNEWNYPETDNLNNDVDSWPPNPLGIYALGSGATEWVNDWFSADYYKHSPEKDPQGPSTGSNKVQRGMQSNRPVVTARYIGQDKNDYYPRNGFRCSLQQNTTIK